MRLDIFGSNTIKLEGGIKVYQPTSLSLFSFLLLLFLFLFHSENFQSQLSFLNSIFTSSLPNRKLEILTMRPLIIILSNNFVILLFLFRHQTDLASLVTKHSDYLHLQIILENFPSHFFHKAKSCNIPLSILTICACHLEK